MYRTAYPTPADERECTQALAQAHRQRTHVDQRLLVWCDWLIGRAKGISHHMQYDCSASRFLLCEKA